MGPENRRRRPDQVAAQAGGERKDSEADGKDCERLIRALVAVVVTAFRFIQVDKWVKQLWIVRSEPLLLTLRRSFAASVLIGCFMRDR